MRAVVVVLVLLLVAAAASDSSSSEEDERQAGLMNPFLLRRYIQRRSGIQLHPAPHKTHTDH